MDTLTELSNVNQQAQEALVKHHAVLVKRIAYHLLGRLPQSVQLDDLIQAGMMGLLEASRNYDADKGASFETYAGIRIKGHMLDEVRSNDWVPRSVHKNSRMIAEAVKKVEDRLGREAFDSEIAEELQLSLNEYHEILQNSVSNHLYGFDDLGISDEFMQVEGSNVENQPHTSVMHTDMMLRLGQMIENLPDKERLVLSLYYEQDLNLKEIGEILEVSESRVSQILSQATLRVKSRMMQE